MGTILASTIIDKAEIILLDDTNVRWTATELLGWLNDGQRDACILKPEAYVISKAVQLAAGAKQTLGAGSTADASLFLGMVRNLGTNGTTVGNAIRAAQRETLDAVAPDWQAMTATATVIHYVYDPVAPKQVYVYPPNTGTGYVEMVYAAIPPTIASGAAISLDDTYANALMDYILYRAFSKEAEYADGQQRAVAHYTAFASAFGAQEKNLAALNPNLQYQPAQPGLPATAA